MRRTQELAVRSALTTVLVLGIGAPIISSFVNAAPAAAVRCFDGPLQKEAGFNAAVSDISNQHHLHLGAAAILQWGGYLHDYPNHESPHAGQLIHINVSDRYQPVGAGFGSCPHRPAPPRVRLQS